MGYSYFNFKWFLFTSDLWISVTETMEEIHFKMGEGRYFPHIDQLTGTVVNLMCTSLNAAYLQRQSL